MLENTIQFQNNFDVLSVEDFILTKLARADRSSTDINDILQILITNKKNIDWEYLHYRLKWIDLVENFKEILHAFTLEFDQQYKNLSKEIIEKFKDNKED